MAAAFTLGDSAYNYALPPLIGGITGSPTGGTFSFGTPYTTGGVAVAADLFFPDKANIVAIIFGAASVNGLIHAVLNAAGTHVLAYNNSGVEIANGTDLSAAGFNLTAIAYVQ